MTAERTAEWRRFLMSGVSRRAIERAGPDYGAPETCWETVHYDNSAGHWRAVSYPPRFTSAGARIAIHAADILGFQP